MIRFLPGGSKTGAVTPPSSKSYLHRYLICGALGANPCRIFYKGYNQDIAATEACLLALGAGIQRTEHCFTVSPLSAKPNGPVTLPCGESGSTLRFLLPVVGALGIRADFVLGDGLAVRPIRIFKDVLAAGGMSITEKDGCLSCSGALRPGLYTVPGNISSQYISGLLLALPLLNGCSRICVTGGLESAGYVKITMDVLRQAGILPARTCDVFDIQGPCRPALPATVKAETDWSAAAFFLSMGALSRGGIAVHGLNMSSCQGDRAILSVLQRYGAKVTVNGDCVTVTEGERKGIIVDGSDIPDLVPVIASLAAGASGQTDILNIGRLRYKESDRIETTAALLRSVGARVETFADGLRIFGAEAYEGGEVNPRGDHRIAMSAAVPASLCTRGINLSNAECVAKSYPDFWRDYFGLTTEGVSVYEQQLR